MMQHVQHARSMPYQEDADWQHSGKQKKLLHFFLIFSLSSVQSSSSTYVTKALAKGKKQQMALSPGVHV